MKKRNVESKTIVYDNNFVTITKETNQELFFEIGDIVTTDVAEAVAIMIVKGSSGIWDVLIDNTVEVDPERCLYWLSGGQKEWFMPEHYNTIWSNCYLEFQEEFGFMVVDIIRKSKTLGDVRSGFIKYLNLPILYDFAISRNLIK